MYFPVIADDSHDLFGREIFFFEGSGQLYTGEGLLDMDSPCSVMENNAVL